MRFRTLFMLLLLFLLGSCASTGTETRVYDAEKTRVRVDNQNVMSMTIYVLQGSERLQLGLVPGLSVRTFVIPDYMVSRATSLRLLADPVGSNHSPISEEFSVMKGAVLEMLIRPF